MARFETLNHYELLEVSVNASSFEIRQAYREALSVYAEDSLISSAFFTDGERNHILKRVEEAFSVLIDEGKRARYNKELVASGQMDSSVFESPKVEQKGPIPLFSMKERGGPRQAANTLKNRVEKEDFSEIRNQMDGKEHISGQELKDFRKKLGIAIEEIFEETRISTKVLEAIEADDLKGLPPKIYLKNFIKAYAELLKLNSKSVTDGYLKHIARLEKSV